MKIAVLGGSGFVGYNVSIELIKHGYIPDIYSRRSIDSTAIDPKMVHYFDLNSIKQSIYSIEYDVVIYCIGHSDYNQKECALDDFRYFCTRIKTKSMIYISSSSVYMGKYGILHEDCLGKSDALNTYALNKINEESILQSISTIEKIFIIRPRAIYGVGDRVLLYNILQKTIREHTVYIGSKQGVITSLTHINTLTDFIIYIINKKHSISSGLHTFNIADSQSYNLYEAFQAINSIFFQKKPFILGGKSLWYMQKIGLISNNYYTGMIDIFGGDKILNIDKATELGFNSLHNYYDTLPVIYSRRKEKIGSIQNMKHYRHRLPRMT